MRGVQAHFNTHRADQDRLESGSPDHPFKKKCEFLYQNTQLRLRGGDEESHSLVESMDEGQVAQ